ncbi:hypothetical protein EDC04DRAFT_2662422 [Pisolithus marmoratus]|nr:hypothetical protein EDC04DRAFT_2662422 [Pisolithus marmoratus]
MFLLSASVLIILFVTMKGLCKVTSLIQQKPVPFILRDACSCYSRRRECVGHLSKFQRRHWDQYRRVGFFALKMFIVGHM